MTGDAKDQETSGGSPACQTMGGIKRFKGWVSKYMAGGAMTMIESTA